MPSHRLLRPLALLLLVSLCQCSFFSRKAVVEAGPRVEWYIASQEPVTLCPKGHQIPAAGTTARIGTFVLLADRRTRFYIPPEHSSYFMRDALEIRQASRRASRKVFATTESTLGWLSGTLGPLLVGQGASAAAAVPGR